jgi:hypothetical protein
MAVDLKEEIVNMYLSGEIGHYYVYYVDVSKIKRTLCLDPEIAFEDEMSGLVE